MTTMDNYTAVAIAESFGGYEDASRDEQLAAWQHLVNTGMAWKLQGAAGMAQALIDRGDIEPAPFHGAQHG